MGLRLGLPRQVERVFWALTFVEATFGAYLGIWPLWIERLGAPIAVVGLVLGSSGLVRLFVLAPSAEIAERLGIRRTLLLSRAAMAIALLSAALATHWTHLAITVLGAAIAELTFPLSQAHVATHAGDQRMRAFVLVFTVGPSIALAVSPLLAGALVAIWGIRAAFVLALVFTAASFVAFLSINDDDAGLRAREASSTYREALADPTVRLVASLLLVTIFSLSLGTSFIPTFLADVRGIDAAVIATFGSAAAVGSAFFGLLVARLRPLQRAPFLGVVIAVTGAALGFVLFRATGALPLILVAFLLRGGLFSAWAMLSAAFGELAPARHRARGFAICEMVGGLAFSFGPMVAGRLYDARPGLPFELATILALALVPVLIAAQGRADRLHAPAQTESAAPVGPAA